MSQTSLANQIPLPISLVVIAFNEEANIERCLKSVPFAGEILVVDSFSMDRTVEIAQKCGARVIQQEWLGFGPQKAFAAERAKYEWILSLDADEALSPELQTELIQKFAQLQSDNGYYLPRLSFHLGRWIHYGGWRPDYQLRLFNKTRAQWNTAALHERVEAPQTARLENNILHWVFKDISHQVRTNDHYSSLGARARHQEGEKFSLFRLITNPLSKFVETYFWKRGFLDGLPGFIISVGAAYSIFLRWAKMWEHERTRMESNEKV